MSELAVVVRTALRERRWPVTCIRRACGPKAIMTGSPPEREAEAVTLSCPVCAFTIDIPVEWYQLSSSKTLGFLLRNVPGVEENGARTWVNNVKYTHPTYWLSQKFERDLAKDSFQRVVAPLLRSRKTPESELRVLAVGANNCLELEALPFKWQEKNVFAVDLARGALAAARTRWPGLRTIVEFAETLSQESKDTDGKPLGETIAGTIDICLALRMLQSSGLQLWSSLTRIRDALKPGGWLVASVPKRTAMPSGNVHPGIYRSDGVFDEDGPRKTAERLASELSSGSRMYEEVTLFYGAHFDPEYYVVARRHY